MLHSGVGVNVLPGDVDEFIAVHLMITTVEWGVGPTILHLGFRSWSFIQENLAA